MTNVTATEVIIRQEVAYDQLARTNRRILELLQILEKQHPWERTPTDMLPMYKPWRRKRNAFQAAALGVSSQYEYASDTDFLLME